MTARTTVRFFVVVLLCMGFAHAHALQCADPGSTLLWEVESKNSRVHLFGSLHLGEPDFYPLPEKIETAFRQADHLVFELDPRTFADPAVAGQMLQAGMLPPGQQLNQLVSAEVLEQLQRALAPTGLPLQQVMNFRPWFITTVLATFQYAALGYSPDYGVEQYLARQLPTDREIISLETLEQQLSTLQHLDGEGFLAQALAEFNQGQELAQHLVNAWRCADKEALSNLLHQSFTPEDPELAAAAALVHDALFVKRNRHMAQRIQHFLESGEGHYFVVVGSGHYLSDGSIIDMLKANGYDVKPVRLEP